MFSLAQSCILNRSFHSLISKWCRFFFTGTFVHYIMLTTWYYDTRTPRWGAVGVEIKVPSGDNTELKHSPFKAWSRSVYSHTCYAYCQEFLPCLFLPFQSIHLHFFQNLSWLFHALAVANTGSCLGPQNKIGQLAGCRFPCWVPAEYR